MAYLRWLLQRFDGDLRLSLAGYNAGERAVERYGDVPPYAETREYVRRILSRYGDSRA
jgi:soluble lytic murein transglycosylase-like protein